MEDYTDFDEEKINGSIGYNPFGYQKFSLTDDAFLMLDDEDIEDYFENIINNEKEIVNFFSEIDNIDFQEYYFLYDLSNKIYTIVFIKREYGEKTKYETKFTKELLEEGIMF